MLCIAQRKLYITGCSNQNPIVPHASLSCGNFREKTSMKNSKKNLSRTICLSGISRALVLLLLFTLPALSQTKVARSGGGATSLEQRAELNLKAARENPLQLRHFLLGMPKGGDLHNHLSGAVYAESWIRAGAEDRLFVDFAKLAFVKPQGSSSCGTEQAERGEGKV